MSENQTQSKDVDAYIALFPQELQDRLSLLRLTIHACAPEANERMAYQMPTFYLYGNLIHYACFTHHIGIYPGALGVEHFLGELKDYKTAKGTIQIPHTMALPIDLIQRIVYFRVEENFKEGLLKKKKKHV